MSYDDVIKAVFSGFSQFQWYDLVDILLISFLLYKLIIWTKETQAYQVLKGIAVLFLCSVASQLLQLNTLSWLLDSFLKSGTIIMVIVILFQPEIRRMLERLGRSGKKLGSLFETTTVESESLERAVQRLALLKRAVADRKAVRWEALRPSVAPAGRGRQHGKDLVQPAAVGHDAILRHAVAKRIQIAADVLARAHGQPHGQARHQRAALAEQRHGVRLPLPQDGEPVACAEPDALLHAREPRERARLGKRRRAHIRRDAAGAHVPLHQRAGETAMVAPDVRDRRSAREQRGGRLQPGPQVRPRRDASRHWRHPPRGGPPAVHTTQLCGAERA